MNGHTPNTPQRPSRPALPATADGPGLRSGNITIDELIHGDAEKYRHLDGRIEQLVDSVQRELVATGAGNRIVAARTDPEARQQLKTEIDRLALSHLISGRGVPRDEQPYLIESVTNEILGLGPLEPFWQDPGITEVMVNGPDTAYVEKDGIVRRATGVRFRSQQHLLDVCQKIVAPLNRKLDVKSPIVDGRLPDGSRVNVTHQAIAPKGPLLTIRRFPEVNRSLADLVDLGSMSQEMAQTLTWLVAAKATTLVVGGTGTGKALHIDTPIPTPTGFTTMGELQVGDTVYGADGQIINVTGAYDIQHGRETFEVVFDDGSVIVADGEHLWETENGQPPAADPPPSTPEATQIAAAAAHYPPDAALTATELCSELGWRPQSRHLHRIRQTLAPIPPLPASDTTDEPAWLARQIVNHLTSQNGPTSSLILTTNQIRATLHTADGAPRHRVRLAGPTVTPHETGETPPPLPTPPHIFGQELADGAHTHIPRNYLDAPAWQRRDILDGLLGQCGRAEIGDPNLARQVATLAASCGYRTRRTVDPETGRTSIRLPGWAQPDPRPWREIVQIRPAGPAPVRCIRVDSADHLFLAGHSHIPTHNTTLLNALSAAIPRSERVITIEDSLELRLAPTAHVAAAEARPPDASGGNAVTIRALVKNALRQRPDRIIVGEVRDESALEMLQACNTGHEGSMSTVHANGPNEAVARLSVMVAQGGEFPSDRVDWLVGSALDLIVMIRRYKDGSRRVSGIYEVPEIEPGNFEHLATTPLWEWVRTGTDGDGKAVGEYVKRNDISTHLSDKLGLKFEPYPQWEDVLNLNRR